MIYENVLRLCKLNNISISRLERELGFGNATIRGWSKSSPRAEKLQKVAAYFGVTMEELMTPQASEDIA
jgi:transcriptional regulator with XRE-family HTH domain